MDGTPNVHAHRWRTRQPSFRSPPALSGSQRANETHWATNGTHFALVPEDRVLCAMNLRVRRARGPYRRHMLHRSTRTCTPAYAQNRSRRLRKSQGTRQSRLRLRMASFAHGMPASLHALADGEPCFPDGRASVAQGCLTTRGSVELLHNRQAG
jgi:hypothetical protein